MTEPAGELRLTVYGRAECHLCDDLIAALKPWQNRYNLLVEEVDIDSDADLTARYAARIPVLTLDDVEVCQYFLDEQSLQRLLDDKIGHDQPHHKY